MQHKCGEGGKHEDDIPTGQACQQSHLNHKEEESRLAFLSSMFSQRSEGGSQVGILLQLPCLGGSSIWLQQGFDAAAPLVLQLLSSPAPIVRRDRTHWKATLTKLNCWLQHLNVNANLNELHCCCCKGEAGKRRSGDCS